jgi:hypothetical protein
MAKNKFARQAFGLASVGFASTVAQGGNVAGAGMGLGVAGVTLGMAEKAMDFKRRRR